MLDKELILNSMSGIEAEKEAQDLIAGSGRPMDKVKVHFSLLFEKGGKVHIVPCTWLDPYFGFFQVDDIEGMTRMSDMPKDFRVIGQSLEDV